MNAEHPTTAGGTSSQVRQGRSDLNNSNVREDLARTGRCAMVHLPTGRICLLPFRHHGPCEFHRPQEADDVMSGGH
ncbi:hypothetical protein [Arthrobacter sp. 9AX]|uniref:hypothetical protein n=1 Tax=Arthrobacter sp. 9AX TaxID=2653131 RepID=UPI001356F02A|nr:hypothetical protein [Arthrobacter sp. 9AX]